MDRATNAWRDERVAKRGNTHDPVVASGLHDEQHLLRQIGFVDGGPNPQVSICVETSRDLMKDDVRIPVRTHALFERE